MRRTTIPNSSFLIPYSRKAFIHNQWTEPPKELTLNPEPNESKVKRGCEEMMIHFFTAPFLMVLRKR